MWKYISALEGLPHVFIFTRQLKLREVLLLYLAVSKYVNKSVLLREDKSGTTTHLLHQQGHD